MIKIGIIGAGPNAEGHARYYAATPRSQVVAIADPDTGRAMSLADQTGGRSTPDFRDFLDEVDAVVISSPNFLHREHAIACAEAGKAVYCEKPAGLNLEDARAIADAVRKARVVSTVGFTVRFDGTIQTMDRMLRAGELGDLISLTSRRLMYMSPAKGGWRADHALSGGLLLEVNIHEVEWMMALGGPVKFVYAQTRSAHATSERSNDQIWVTLGFQNGAVGFHEGSWLSSNVQFFRAIEGTRAGLATNEWGNQLYLGRPGENRTDITPDPVFDLRGHFLDCIEHGATPVADIPWGANVMAVCDAIFESAKRVGLVLL